jgi:hypothetical protein
MVNFHRRFLASIAGMLLPLTDELRAAARRGQSRCRPAHAQMPSSPIGWHILASQPLSKQTEAPNSPLQFGPLPAHGWASSMCSPLPTTQSNGIVERVHGRASAPSDQKCFTCLCSPLSTTLKATGC